MKKIVLKFDSLDDVPKSLKELWNEETKEVIVVSGADAETAKNLTSKISNKSKFYESSLKGIIKSLGHKDISDFSEETLKENMEDIEKTISELAESHSKVQAGELDGLDTEELEEKIKERLSPVHTEYQTKISAKDKALSEKEEKISTLQSSIGSMSLMKNITELLGDEKIGLNPAALEAIAFKAGQTFQYDPETGEHTPKKDGQTIYDGTGANPISFSEWATTTLKKEAPYAFMNSSGSGDTKGNTSDISDAQRKNMSTSDKWSSF